MLGLGGPLGFPLGGPPGTVPPSRPTPRGNTGTDITLGNRSEKTGRFNFVTGDDGDVQFDQTEGHAVMTSVVERRNEYWADATHGSELRKLQNLTNRTPSQARAMMLDGVSSLVEDDAIENVVASAKSEKKNGRLIATISWSTPASDETFSNDMEL